MNKSKILVLLLAMLMIISVSAVSAAEDIADSADVLAQDDSTTLEADDAVDVQADPEPAAEPAANFTTLQTEISNAGNNLTLEKDYTRVADDNKEIEINKDFTIDGQGKYTLDGNKMGRFFVVKEGSTLTLKGLTLCNGVTQDINNGTANNGGAIFVSQGANLVVENVAFINNTAITNPTTYNYGQGGAIFSKGNVTIKEGSKFINNTADTAGAIFINGTLDVTGAEFSKNTVKNPASIAGAIFANGDKVTIKGSLFKDNYAEFETGAVKLLVKEAIISSTTFANNKANKFQAGAVLVFNGCNLTVNENCIFINNTAAAGGAIYASSAGKLDISGSEFINNTAVDNGGAIYFYDANENALTISDNTKFTNNVAGKTGGALLVAMGHANIEATFTGNNATVNGSAVYIKDNGKANIKNSKFSDNGGDAEYAIYNSGTLALENNTISDKIYSSTEIFKPGSNVTITPIADVTYGNPVVVYFKVENSTGYPTVNVSKKSGDLKIDYPYAVCVINNENVTVTNLTAGQYVINIINNEDNNFAESHESAVFNVTKADPNLQVTAKVNAVGIIEIDATVDKNVTGNITFKVINETGAVVLEGKEEIENGSAKFAELTVLPKGKYNYTVSYENENYNSTTINSETPLVIDKEVAHIDIKSYEVNEYGMIVIKANITKDATGDVTFYFYNTDTGKNLTVPIEIGENGTIDYNELTPFEKGYYYVQIGYNGDDKYYETIETSASVDVNVTKTISILNVYNVTVNQFGYIVVLANVTKGATGNVTYLFTNVGTGKTLEVNITVDEDGVADYDEMTIFDKGEYKINVWYNGDENYYGTVDVEESVEITKTNATLDVYSVSVNEFGHIVVLANLTKGATGNVTYLFTNVGTGKTLEVNITVDEDGVADYDEMTIFDKGEYKINVWYNGDENYYATPDVELSADVNKTAPAIDVYVSSIENNVTVKVIADNNTVSGKVNITLFTNGTEYANVVKNMTNGVVEEFNFTEIEIGDYLVRADFLGSDDFYQTFAVNETNVRASTEMNVTATVNQLGQIEVLANLTKGATGTVLFIITNSSGDNIVNLTAEIDNGTAQDWTTDVLAKGFYNVKAVYSGDDYYATTIAFGDSVEIAKEVPVIEIINVTVNEYGAIVINANITKGASGNVTFLFIDVGNGKNLTVPIEIGENGTIEYDELTPFEKGFYTVVITYDGDDKYYGTHEVTYVEVNKTAPTIDVYASSIENNVTVKVTATNDTVSGQVNITLFDKDGKTVKNITKDMVNGVVEEVTFTGIEIGDYLVRADFLGSDDFYQTFAVNETNVRASTEMNVTATVNQFGQIEVVANLTKGATGTVLFIITNSSGDNIVNLTAEIDNGTAQDWTTDVLAKGFYNVKAVYSGDDYYATTIAFGDSVEIAKEVPVIEIINVTVNEYGAIVINANITKGASGNVTFLFIGVGTGKNLTVPIEIGENGTIEYDELTPFEKGFYTVVITYDGDDKYYGTHEVTYVNVNKTAPAIDVYVSSIENNVTVKVIADNNNVSGKVNITLFDKDGKAVKNITKDMTNGTIEEVTFTGIEIGDYLVRADFLGSDDFYQTFAVNETNVRASTEMNVTATVNQFGQIEVVANLTKGATGTVQFIIRNSSADVVANLTAEINNGTAQDRTADVLAKGVYFVTAIYSGDDYYGTITDFDGSAEITKEYLDVTSKVSIMDGANQATIVFTFSGNASGNATAFFLNYGTNASYAIQNGTVVIDEIFDNGAQSVLLTYDGDEKYYGFYNVYANFFVKTSSFISAKDVNVVYQNNGKVTVTLYDNNDGKGKNPIANAEIVITLNGKQYKAKTNAKGIATVTIAAKLVPKKYTATVSYAGTNVTVGDKETFKFTVKKATPKLTAKKKTFKAKTKVKKYTIVLKDNKNKVMKKVKVYLKVKGKTYTAKTNSKGKAVFKIKKLTKKGTYKAKVTFKGNKYFNKVTKTAKIKVKR